MVFLLNLGLKLLKLPTASTQLLINYENIHQVL